MLELCVRSEWTRDVLSIGPTVFEQETYDLPTNFRKPLDWLTVDVFDYVSADLKDVRGAKLGELDLAASGVWWIAYESGARKLGIHPIGDGGDAINLYAVVTPDLLVDGADEPITPTDFDQAIVDYVTAISQGASEDALEERDSLMSEFDRQVERLHALVVEVEQGTERVRGVDRGIPPLMPRGQTVIGQDDFGAGIVLDVPPHLIPEDGALEIINGIPLLSDGAVHLRGGTSWKTTRLLARL